ncbi:MAG: DEAD/DEAH box helicase [Candidatus Sungbacteria bacterium]|nr:DEAD/DEAH box helicase [Candidatus Sungbacteria bacterium]
MKKELPPAQFLIAAVTPSFLERGALWFSENEEKILKAAKTQPWWQKNILVLERGSIKKLSELLRELAELRYQKTHAIVSPGEFSQLGDTIRVSPVNREEVVRLEFRGNNIESIVFEPFRFPEAAKKPPKTKRVFREGEYLVHLDHGIGIYRGLENNFHVIEYAAPRASSPKDRLLVPLDQEKKLSLYIGFETPTIHRLGGQLWPNTKRKIKESAEAFARELLKVYAARENVSRPPLMGDTAVEGLFADKFQFVETPSQIKACGEILADMENQKPMDRILAGDVGFGKTEVAMRASLRAVLSGHRVAVLAPTTILVEQHQRTFSERFADFPIKIASLSRLTANNEEKRIVAELARGEIDIVIGTHRLLAKDIEIPKLGFLIIDEEQKFGVAQKEHFKKLRAQIDILSLSATPIPRTLSLTMANLRGISQITDPPPERIAVKNFVLPWSEDIVKKAIETELIRDGQVYVLHNRVETIGLFAKNMQSLVPEANIGIIHGRMHERELLKTLTRFRNKEINVLVATTIIENGLDFSNVNTLIVENATRLGLAQAYQIRGRIGRGDREAFAYFLYPAQHLTDGARERLETLEAFEALGSGYEIALRDLEMRGAGAILGRDQSGAIQKGGLNLYCQLLADALESLKSAQNVSLTSSA